MRKLFGLLVALCVLSACEKDGNPKAPKFENGVFVMNEGNFGGANGQVDFIGADGVYSSAVYADTNGVGLGDIVQSMYIKDTLGFIVVNNEAKIEIVNASTMVQLGTLTSTSPRYATHIGNTLYVTDLFSGSIATYDISTGTAGATIAAAGWTENIFADGNDFYALNIPAFGDSTTPTRIIKGSAGSNTANPVFDMAGTCFEMTEDVNSAQILFTETVNDSDYLVLYNYITDEAFYPATSSSALGNIDAQNGIVAMMSGGNLMLGDIVAGDVQNWSSTPISGLSTAYKVTLDPTGAFCYISDAKDFSAAGEIFIVDVANKTLIDRYNAGIIPSNVTFIN